MRRVLSAMLIGSSVLANQRITWADDDQSKADQTQPTRASVQATVIAARALLKEVGQSCRHIKQSAKDLLYESQRPVMAFVGTPTVIGTMVIPAQPDPSGIVNLGSMYPPRKQWVDYFKSQITFPLTQLQENVPAIVVAPEDQTVFPLVEEMKKQVGGIERWYEKLNDDSQPAQMHNSVIAKDAEAIILCAESLDKDRKDLEKDLKKYEKQQP